MKKTQMMIGLAVGYDDSHMASPIVEIHDDVVVLANGMALPIFEVTEAESSYWKKYNHIIREVYSKYNGRFNKNDDKDIYESGDHIWFTSDTHFCHENIIKFCGRPFETVEEMNKALVDKWNSIVGPNDIVYHLGDFCWGGSDNWNWILQHLNGHIHLVLGNHDVKNIRQGYMKYFDSVTFQRQITIEGRSIYLNHYPFLTYGGIYRKDSEKVWQLFGHVHSKEGSGGADSGRLQYLLPTQYDVGVDNNNYGPISWADVKAKIDSQVANPTAIQRAMMDSQYVEHLELKNNILMNLLTQEQKKQFEEMITDKPETCNRVKDDFENIRDQILNISWQIHENGIYRPSIWMPMTEVESFKQMRTDELDSLDQAEIMLDLSRFFDYEFDDYQTDHLFLDGETMGHFADRVGRIIAYRSK